MHLKNYCYYIYCNVRVVYANSLLKSSDDVGDDDNDDSIEIVLTFNIVPFAGSFCSVLTCDSENNAYFWH